jgi:hypothetical protein
MDMTDLTHIFEGLTARGFEVCATGGGCTAWHKKLNDNAYILVTDDCGFSADDLSEGAIIGLYGEDGGDPLNSWNVNADQILEWTDKATEWLAK